MGRPAATESMPDFAGRVLDDGRYEIFENMGTGAYGKVYRALDTFSPPKKPKYVAVKCLLRHSPGSHNDELQKREIAHHQLVSGHPNVVTFHRWFRDDSFVYVILELCRGGDLFTAITDKKIFHEKERLIKSAFIQIIDAIHHCHEQGVYHRDVKPENVLCSFDGTVLKLADFGLSTTNSFCEEHGCGSSYYMSPECIGREFSMGKYSAQHSDIWALGVILTNIITGRNPWRYATSSDECFSAYLKNENFLRTVLPISIGVNSVLKKLFCLDPVSRIPLPELRREIFALDSLYMSKKDLASSNICCRYRVKPVNDVPFKAALGRDILKPIVEKTDCASKTSLDSDERYTFDSPTADHPQAVEVDTMSVISNASAACSTNDCSIGQLSFSTLPSSGSASGPESRGPITPATHAKDLSTEVPEISNGEGLQSLGSVAITETVNKFNLASTANAKKSTSRPSQLFRMAFRRIKAFPSSSSS